MALIPCPECGREVSTRASSCPGCGCPIGQAAEPPVMTSAPAAGPDPVDPEVDLNMKICQFGASIVGGELSLIDKTTPHIPHVVAQVAGPIQSGAVTGLHLCGDAWRDEHVQELVALLLPSYSSFYSLVKGVSSDTYERLGNLTDLRLTRCPALTDKGMSELSKLATLRKLHMMGWAFDESNNALNLIKFARLPRLELLEIPYRMRLHEVAPGTGIGYYSALKDTFGPSVLIQ